MPESLNSARKRSYLNVIVPTKIEATLLVFLSACALVFLNIFKVVSVASDGEYRTIVTYIRENINLYLAPTETELGTNILTIMMWMIFGTVMYVILMVILSVVSAFKSDKTIDKKLIVPTGFNPEDSRHEFATRLLIRLIALFCLVAWAFIFFSTLLPSASQTFLESIMELSFKSVLSVTFSIFSLAASTYVFFVLSRILFLRYRVFEG